MEMLVLLMGSNTGRREARLQQALEAMGERIGPPICSSRIWETQAWGGVADGDFLNQAHRFEADVEVFRLLAILQEVEGVLGRTLSERWGNREIDIDILVYGSLCLRHESLNVPHLHLSTRRFALVPLHEVAPEWRHPETGNTAAEMLLHCRDDSKVVPFEGSPQRSFSFK